MEDESKEFFVFYQPLVGEFDELLGMAPRNDLTEQMVKAKEMLVNCVPEEEGIYRMMSDDGLLIWGPVDCAAETLVFLQTFRGRFFILKRILNNGGRK